MWRLDVTERVHAIRAAMPLRWADPEWTKMVDLTVPCDRELLRVRCGMAYRMPGVEVM